MTISVKNQIEKEGCIIIPNVLSQDEVKTLKAALEAAIEKENEWHGSKNYQDYGMVLMCAKYDKCLVDVFANDKLMAPFNEVLGEGCIVYAYQSSSMPPSSKNYSVRIHADCPRIIPGYITNMGATIALDDFTVENGATLFLPGSQNQQEAPTPEAFTANAKRFIAPAGSVLYFNARIWHSGGENKTSKWRHALTINMCRSYMKQRFDIPRMLQGNDVIANASPKALQKLGFHSQPPASYEEYYAPVEKRTYKQRVE